MRQAEELAAEVAVLRQDNAGLMRRLAALESRLPAPPEPASTPEAASITDRRGLLVAAGTGALAAAAGFVPAMLVGAEPALADSGPALVTRMDFSTPAVSPPALDTGVRWARRDPVGVPARHTNQVLSLISENSQINSYAWPLYIELRTTTATAANQSSSQSAGATVRMFASSAGSPWNTAFHAEAQHGWRWTPQGFTAHSTNSTSIGYNMELYRVSGGGAAIGVVVLNSSQSAYPGDSAIRVLGRWNTGVHFPALTAAETEAAGGPGAKLGGAAIAIEAPYEVGLSLGPNDMRLAPGRRIILDEEHGVWLTYNRETTQVEIHRGGKLAAAL